MISIFEYFDGKFFIKRLSLPVRVSKTGITNEILTSSNIDTINKRNLLKNIFFCPKTFSIKLTLLIIEKKDIY